MDLVGIATGMGIGCKLPEQTALQTTAVTACQ
jgi:hypothetical protein